MKEVPQKWWHRLLLVALTLIVASVALTSLTLAINASFVWRTHFSWEKDYVHSPKERRCEVIVFQHMGETSLTCGFLTNPSDVLELLSKAGAAPPIYKYVENEYGAGVQLKSILDRERYVAYSERPFSWEEFAPGFGKAVLATGFTAFLAWALYVLVLYVVYGARVKIVRPNFK